MQNCPPYDPRTPHPGHELKVALAVANSSLAVRWGSARVFEEGFVGVPTALIARYARLGLSPGEFMFVLELMTFKWNENAPFPNYHTLAHRMGVSTEMVRRHAKSLESKGLLKRLERKGQSELVPMAETNS